MTGASSPVVTARVAPPADVPQNPTASAISQVAPTLVQTNAAAASSAPRVAALELTAGSTVASDTSAVPAVVADQGRRVALVIGNATYQAAPALDNPRLDAEAVADSLRSAGFTTVTLVKDATLQQMKKALRNFELEADAADWAVVYYAGHGLEIGGHNYLIPVDARLDSDRDADDEAVPLDYVLSKLEKARKLQLVILDACRDDPFRATMKRATASRSLGRGLARIEPSANNELVVFAAKDGEQALDGTSSGHSPFAQALIARLAMPRVEINKMFRLVTSDVMTATQNTQRPFVYGSTLGNEDFYFRTQ